MKRKSQQGVALVITLILLAVITFMTITFLVLSRHNSEQTDTEVQQAIARHAGRQGVEYAISRAIATMLAQNNGFNSGAMVSTNFESPYFQPGVASITNVNFFDATGAPLAGNNLQRMLANQLVLPRVPVFIITNKFTGALEFRFYVDLNRNNQFDPNNANAPFAYPYYPNATPSGTLVVTNQFGLPEAITIGDPEWVGVLEHPDQPHSSSNRYIARWAFIALPVGNSLDINAIHNNAERNYPQVGFLRNEGAGSWEINLAGFLNGLNPSNWPYSYTPMSPSGVIVPPSSGSFVGAFPDALDILQYRYFGNIGTLASFASLFPSYPTYATNYDLYGFGPLMIGTNLPIPGAVNTSLPWSGADNTNHFFTTQEYFNSLNSPLLNGFAGRLQAVGTAPDGFDEYTFYRMLSQIGTDTAPETTNKINLNYVNVAGYNATNLISWDNTNFPYNSPYGSNMPGSVLFFSYAADALLKSQPEFNGFLSITNIPIYPFNSYTPAVHRLLQLAANIYDATRYKTNSGPNFDYPTVFRPMFSQSGTNIFISGYEEVPPMPQPPLTGPIVSNYLAIPMPLAALSNGIGGATNLHTNIFGIPWIIGARQGFPNFNQVSMQSVSAITRKVLISRGTLNNTDRSQWTTNVQYVVGISNIVGAQVWNSYATPYPRDLDIYANDLMTMNLTNNIGLPVAVSSNLVSPTLSPTPATPVVPAVTWQGFPLNSAYTAQVSNSFKIPIYAQVQLLPESIMHANGSFTVVSNAITAGFDPVTPTTFPLPQYGLGITNRLRLFMVDHASGRIIDYVQLDGMTGQRNLIAELQGNDDFGPGGVWDTNRQSFSTSPAVPLLGVINQVSISSLFYGTNFTVPGYTTHVTPSDWTSSQYSAQGFSSVTAAVSNFASFYNAGPSTNIAMQVPFTPTRSVSVYYTWQANDPLVHYTLGDLTGLGDLSTAALTTYNKTTNTDLVMTHIYGVNKRYLPWNGTGNQNSGTFTNYTLSTSFIDPQVTRSDSWQFPTNRFPGIGWLGQVHRGTPWQTVYMKPAPTDPNFTALWQNWTGNPLGFDAQIAMPQSDYEIFDLFTAALNDNATRGQLPVNQTNFAAWQAALAGVITLSNDDTNGIVPHVIDPNADALALLQIISAINANRTNFPGGVYTRLGDILTVPNLTLSSPFVNSNAQTIMPTDAVYERIPQQIMSLLRVGSPRYVIYAWGQSLKPADHSIVTGGPFYGLCTNYQITGESGIRAVVRIENTSTRTDPMNPTRNPIMPKGRVSPPRAVIESFTVLPPE